jgi:hypothetical protein
MLSDYITITPNNRDTTYLAYSRGMISYVTLCAKLRDIAEQEEMKEEIEKEVA